MNSTRKLHTLAGSIPHLNPLSQKNQLVAIVETIAYVSGRGTATRAIDKLLALKTRLSTTDNPPLVFSIFIIVPQAGYEPTISDPPFREMDALVSANLITDYCALASTIDLTPVETFIVDISRSLEKFARDIIAKTSQTHI